MNITIRKMFEFDYESACMLLDFRDADEEFLSAFRSKDENVYCIYDNEQLVGMLEFLIDKNSFIYIYVEPIFRDKGIGLSVLKLCEDILLSKNVEKLGTRYRADCKRFKAFANKNGFNRKFTSQYMKYLDGRFDVPELPIEQYQDKYYESAHEMYANAFHEMRINIGDFPDSVVEQPSDIMRKNWANTSNERFVYIVDNKIVGYAHVHGNTIGSVSIRKEFQGQGIGRNFMKFLCNKIYDEGHSVVSLFCVLGNKKAKNLYYSLNFKNVYTSEYAIKYINKNV